MLPKPFPQRTASVLTWLALALVLWTGVRGVAEGRQLSPTLTPYLSCRSIAGATLVQMTPLIAAPSKRAVQTLQGDRQISIADGARLSYKINGVDYAFLRVEELPFESYLQGRADLLSNFKRLVSGDELAFPEDALPPTFDGFEIVGSNHHVMLGEVLGLYLLIDTRTHVAVTLYFQNTDMAHHSFSTMEEYASLRNGFLAGYAGCVRAAQQQH